MTTLKKMMLYASVLLIMVTLITSTGCEKEEQPRFVHHGILHGAGSAYVDVKVTFEANRSSSNPLSYDSLANWGYNHISSAAKADLTADISNCVAWYGERYWRTKPNHQWKVWANLNIGVHPDIYALSTQYSDELLALMESYCEFTVNGAVGQSAGVRDSLREAEIINLMDQKHEWAIKRTLRNWAQDPSCEPKRRRDGLMNTSWNP